MNSAERHQRVWAGLLSFAVGLFLSYVIWSEQPGLQVPPIIGYLAAGAFIAAGATLLLQAGGAMRAQLLPAFLMVAALAAVGGWIGFGPGSRRCGGSVGFIDFLPGELTCRAVFGVGALLTGLIAGLILSPLFKHKRRDT